MIASALLLAQTYKHTLFVVPPPSGIYKPDFSTCSKKDADLYKATLPGYLLIAKDYFNIASYDGSWTRKGNTLDLATSSFMGHEVRPDETGKSTKSSFIQGFSFDIASNHDLILRPSTAMVMHSRLRFRRLRPVPIEMALMNSSEFLSFSSDDVVGLKTSYSYFSLTKDFGKQYEPQFFEMMASPVPDAVRGEAARCLEGTQNEKIVKAAGELLLQTAPVKGDNWKSIFRRRLIGILRESHLPISFEYANSALDKKNISLIPAYDIAGNSRHPHALEFLQKHLVDDDKDAYAILPNIQKLSRDAAVTAAKKFVDSSDEDNRFQALQTLVECERESADRDKYVQILLEMFGKVDWLKQCEIAESLGKAQTDNALDALRKINHKGSDKPVQRSIETAIAKYKSKLN